MTSRRHVLALLGAAPALGLSVGPARASDLATAAAAFIEKRGNDVINVLNGNTSIEAKRDAVSEILRDSVDVRGVAQFVLGRHWRTANEQQRSEYLRLFEETIIRNLSSRFGELRGVTFAVARSQMAAEDEALVSTTVNRPNNPSLTLEWRVSAANGKPQVIDLVAEGTSLRITQRSEYGAVVQRSGGMDGLLRAMRQQLAQLEQREQAN